MKIAARPGNGTATFHNLWCWGRDATHSFRLMPTQAGYWMLEPSAAKEILRSG